MANKTDLPVLVFLLYCQYTTFFNEVILALFNLCQLRKLLLDVLSFFVSCNPAAHNHFLFVDAFVMYNCMHAGVVVVVYMFMCVCVCTLLIICKHCFTAAAIICFFFEVTTAKTAKKPRKNLIKQHIHCVYLKENVNLLF